jgi:hypothetical protein
MDAFEGRGCIVHPLVDDLIRSGRLEEIARGISDRAPDGSL